MTFSPAASPGVMYFCLKGLPAPARRQLRCSFFEGATIGERCLYITLSETEEELRDSASSHGKDIGDQVEILSSFRRKVFWMQTSNKVSCILPTWNSGRRQSLSSKPLNG